MAENTRGELASLSPLRTKCAELLDVGVETVDNVAGIGDELCVRLTHDAQFSSKRWPLRRIFGIVKFEDRLGFFISGRRGFGRLLVQVALNRIKNSVYELRCFIGRESAGDFQSFI